VAIGFGVEGGDRILAEPESFTVEPKTFTVELRSLINEPVAIAHQ